MTHHHPTPIIDVHPDGDAVATAAAERLIARLSALQSEGRVPSVALTGGGTGIGTLARVATSASRDTVDWRRVELFWGDERFVAADSDDRNERQAREALLNGLDLDADLVHPMPSADGPFGADVDAAAAHYRDLVDAHPPLDIVLLGMGPEGHVASIFPDSDALAAPGSVTAVRNCPKPPPTRISLTLPTIQAASEVWMLVAGSSKADAVGLAVGGADPAEVPAAGARGRAATVWFLDHDAAAQLPT